MTNGEAFYRLAQIGYRFQYESFVDTEGRRIRGNTVVHDHGSRTVFIANTHWHPESEVRDWVRRQVENTEASERVIQILEFCP